MNAELLVCGQVMAIGSTTAGLLADGLVRSGMSVTNVRKLVQTIAFIVPAGAVILMPVHVIYATAEQQLYKIRLTNSCAEKLSEMI